MPTDWKSPNSRNNWLEIVLDSREARESNIKKIYFFNYQIKISEIDFKCLENSWWLNDTITTQGGKYQLEIIIETAYSEQKKLAFEFETAEVTKK